VCCASRAALARAICAASGPSASKDAITIAANPTIAIPTAAENAISERLGIMSALSKTLLSQKLLSLLVL
jgi:hypothetical protein